MFSLLTGMKNKTYSQKSPSSSSIKEAFLPTLPLAVEHSITVSDSGESSQTDEYRRSRYDKMCEYFEMVDVIALQNNIRADNFCYTEEQKLRLIPLIKHAIKTGRLIPYEENIDKYI